MLILNRKDKQDGWPFQESYLSCVPFFDYETFKLEGNMKIAML